MREIKFNAVDEDTGEYVRYNSWRNENYNEDNTDNEHLSLFLEFYFGYKLLQFTGLKDKNGVEIYEGDLLKSESDFILSVEFFSGRFNVVGFDRKLSDIHDLYYYIDHLSRCEVIGNIYENRELLKG